MSRSGRDALDQLEYDDVALLHLLRAIEDPQHDYLDHGRAVKVFVERLAVRQAARELIADSLASEPSLVLLASRFDLDPTSHRRTLDRLDDLTRGLRPNAVNQGQDVRVVVDELAEQLVPEIDLELTKWIPSVREHLNVAPRRTRLPRAAYVLRHCPLHPGAHPRRWYDRIGPFVWIHAVYDYLRSMPIGGYKPRAQITIPGEGVLTFAMAHEVVDAKSAGAGRRAA